MKRIFFDNLSPTTFEEHLNFNFSMNKPEGYRKIVRLMVQAKKFGRPAICFVDIVNTYPGKEAENAVKAARSLIV